MMKIYGISEEDYTHLLRRQEGKCAICKKLGLKLEIDHCHSRGIVRGLLCHMCNVGVGAFEDNPMFLSNAISYLRESEG